MEKVALTQSAAGSSTYHAYAGALLFVETNKVRVGSGSANPIPVRLRVVIELSLGIVDPYEGGGSSGGGVGEVSLNCVTDTNTRSHEADPRINV